MSIRSSIAALLGLAAATSPSPEYTQHRRAPRKVKQQAITARREKNKAARKMRKQQRRG